jgi:hypothetical protein
MVHYVTDAASGSQFGILSSHHGQSTERLIPMYFRDKSLFMAQGHTGKVREL